MSAKFWMILIEDWTEEQREWVMGWRPEEGEDRNFLIEFSNKTITIDSDDFNGDVDQACSITKDFLKKFEPNGHRSFLWVDQGPDGGACVIRAHREEWVTLYEIEQALVNGEEVSPKHVEATTIGIMEESGL